jgi:hypothetical protein
VACNDYIHGFCKTAYSYNVDPEKLIKVALSLKTLGILAGVPMAAGAIGGKLSQESNGGRLRNASVGAASGSAALGGIHAYKTNKVINNATMNVLGTKLPGKLKILPLLVAAGVGGSIGSVGGGLTGTLFGKKKNKKTLLDKLFDDR